MGFDASWTTRRLVVRRDEVARQLGLRAEFVPGSVQETWSRCGKPTCHCAREDDPGHGPRLLWVHYSGGKTRSKTIPVRLVDQVRDGVDAYQAFTAGVAEINQINTLLAEREFLRRPSADRVDPGRSGKKGGSAAS